LKSKELSDELIEKGKRRLEELLNNSLTSVLRNIVDDYLMKLKCWKS